MEWVTVWRILRGVGLSGEGEKLPIKTQSSHFIWPIGQPFWRFKNPFRATQWALGLAPLQRSLMALWYSRRGIHLTLEEVAILLRGSPGYIFCTSGVRWLPLLEYFRAIRDLCRGPRANRVALIRLLKRQKGCPRGHLKCELWVLISDFSL